MAIVGQRFGTEEKQALLSQDYAYQLVLSEDTDVFLMLVPKVDIDMSNGFTFEDAEYYVTTCVDPRMIGVILGVFGSGQDVTGHWGFTYQDLQPEQEKSGAQSCAHWSEGDVNAERDAALLALHVRTHMQGDIE